MESAFNDQYATSSKQSSQQQQQQQQQQPQNGEVVIPFDTSSLGDVPSSRDGIGFAPYVNALASFLLSPNTKAPLTVSIEGPWGTGKSSFMLQLESRLSHASGTSKNHCVWFNAWRCDKDEAVWASFALELIRQIHSQLTFKKRLYSNLKLFVARARWGNGMWYILQALVFLGASLLCSIYLFLHRSQTNNLYKGIDISKASFILGLGYIVWMSISTASKIYSKDISYQLTRLANNPGYINKTAFSKRFEDDVKSIVNCYSDRSSKVYVFIDDLDRADILRSADLMKAINLLLGLEESNMFFIIGLDREMVAAGIAAQHQAIIPYIAAGRSNPGAEPPDLLRIGIDYGYIFLEKFIQIPFRVPSVDDHLVGQWIRKLLDYDQNEASNVAAAKEAGDIAGHDPSAMAQVVSEIASHLKFTPRRLKQYVNVLRLQIIVAFYIGLIDAEGNPAGGRKKQGFDLRRLALFSGLTLKWPILVSDLIADQEILTEILTKAEDQVAGRSKKWYNEPGFKDALQIGASYSLNDVDLSPLLMIMPDASSRASRGARNTAARATATA